MRRSLVRLAVMLAALVMLTVSAPQAQTIECTWGWDCPWPCISGGFFWFFYREEFFYQQCCDLNGDCWEDGGQSGGCCID